MKRVLLTLGAIAIAGQASAACIFEYKVNGYVVVDDGVILLDRSGDAMYHVKLFSYDKRTMRRARSVSVIDGACSYDAVFLADGEVIEARRIRRM